MPGLGAKDPADIIAEGRRSLGLTRLLQQERRITPHPRGGGSTGYDEWYRVDQLYAEQYGLPVDASASSLWRWKQRILRYRQTGNRDRTQLVGIDMVNLSIFLIAHPDGTLDEMAAHIYNEGGDLYSQSVISKRLNELEITKKKASTDAFQAQRADVQFRVHVFFNCPPPLGVLNVPLYKLIDVDEFSITLERCNRTGAWALKCHRVRLDGHYKSGVKLTVLLAIEPGDPRVPAGARGSLQNPRRWVRCVQNGGTTTIVFRDFTDYICNDIETNPVLPTDSHRMFIWDNLDAHHSTYVHQTVTGRGGPVQFSIVPRPPYHPMYGPIEYKICDLTHDMSINKQPEWDSARLERAVYESAQRIGPFNSTFRHCGIPP